MSETYFKIIQDEGEWIGEKLNFSRFIKLLSEIFLPFNLLRRNLILQI